MLWSAFIIGLFGSLHCVGMCGPIALSLPGQRLSGPLLYNVGRVITYAILGVFIGLLGKVVFIAGLQSWLSIAVGVFLLLVVIFSINVEQKLLKLPWLSEAYVRLQTRLGRFIRQRNLLIVGLLNGLLPCGLVYMAVATAITMGSVGMSVLYMVFFGLGTIPLMLAVSLAGNQMQSRFRSGVRRMFPVLLTLMGLLLIYRGLAIDLPVDIRLWTDLPLCH